MSDISQILSSVQGNSFLMSDLPPVLWNWFLEIGPKVGDRLITVAMVGVLLPIYQWWTNIRPRRMVIKQLSNNLAGALDSIDRISREKDRESRMENLDNLASWFRVINQITNSSDLYFKKSHTVFLKQISIEADTRQTAILRVKEKLAEFGLIETPHVSLDVTKTMFGKDKVEYPVMTYEHFLLGTLFKLNMFLAKFGREHNVDFTKKIEPSKRKELKKYWTDQTVKLIN